MKKMKITIFAFAFIFSTGIISAQNISISDVSHTADASAVLDVYSTGSGMLMPRLTSAARIGIASPATGLTVYDTGTSSYWFFDGTAWTEVSYGQLWSKSGSFTYLTNMADWLGIGTSVPTTNVNVFESNADISPAIKIEQTGSGDASQEFSVAAGSFSIGIDNSDSDNFEISSTSSLTGSGTGGYVDPTTMMRIHTENPIEGIVDFNHQSRARAYYQDHLQMIPSSVFTPIEFDLDTPVYPGFDEHGEFTLYGGPGTTSFFTATEEGYYQVNARCEYVLEEDGMPILIPAPYAHVSIGILLTPFITGSTVPYSAGNNLMISGPALMGGEAWVKNNAPNIADIIYLLPGDKIEIYAFHTAGVPLPLLPGAPWAYVSIHKLS